MEKEDLKDSENKRIKAKTLIKKYFNVQNFVTLLILYFLVQIVPWTYEHREDLFGAKEVIIKTPADNFGVEPGAVIDGYYFDLIPKDKSKVITVTGGACTPNFKTGVIATDNEKENNKTSQTTDEQFKPLFPLPLDSPKRLFCNPIKTPYTAGAYSFKIVIYTERGKQEEEIQFYVTKPINSLI